MMRRLLEWLAGRLAPPRVIWDRAGESPYLSRYYLLGRPYMADGSDPFLPDGAPKPDVVVPPGIGIYLHKFHRGDDDFELHSHPWSWAFSIILAGGYVEERRTPDNDVETRTVRPPSLNIIGEEDFHRVELLEKDAWSLFVAGPKVSSWGFWNRWTGEFSPWREFIKRKRSEMKDARA